MPFSAITRGIAIAIAVMSVCFSRPARAQTLAADRVAGKWNWHLSWAGTVDDTGLAEGRVSQDTMVIACTKGCEEPAFLRGTRQSDGQIGWEFWTKAGVQGDCANDKGWQRVRLFPSEDGREIVFGYLLHNGDSCDQLMRAAPVRFRLARD